MTRLIKGDVLQSTVDTNKYQVLGTEFIDGKVELYSCNDSARQYHALQEIHAKIATQEWRLERVTQHAIVSPVDQDSSSYRLQLQRAGKYLRKVLETADKLGISFDRAQQLVRKEVKTNDFPSRAVLYRYRDAHFQDRPLLKGSRNKGRRTARYRPEVYELIRQHAQNLYCKQGSRWRMPALTKFINQQALELGYITPQQCISQRHISDSIRKHGFVDTDAHRLDPKLVAAARSIGAKRIQTSVPLERVEMDSLHLPFHVQTAHGKSSNVWLTHAIDAHTGMPLGWHITIGTPSEDSGLACIHSVLYSKQQAFERLKLSYDFDVYGTPNLIIFDNGAEAKGERTENLVRIGIDTEHCPGRHPHKKPFIERLNRSLKDDLETLPGCTRMNGVDGKRNPISLKDAVMTIEELERWIVRWYYEQWSNQVLERHLMSDANAGVTPLARWKYFAASYVMPLPVPLDDWRKVALIKAQRKLSRKTGVSHQGLNYKGANLPHLLQHLDQGLVTTYSDPSDYRVLFVDDGKQLVELIEEFVHKDSPAYSIEDYKALCKERWQQARDTNPAGTFLKDIYARSVEDAGHKPRGKSTEENRQTTGKFKESKAIKNTIQKPLSHAAIGEVVTTLNDFPRDFLDLPTLDVLDRKTGGVKV